MANVAGSKSQLLSSIAPSPATPPFAMWQAINDANANTFAQDTFWTSGVNLTNGISNFPGISKAPANGDTTYMQFGVATFTNGWFYSGKGTQANTTSGPSFGTCRTYTARAFPKLGGAFAAGSQPNFFFGICKNQGDAAGLHTGFAIINGNGAQTDAGWRQNNVGIGYVGFLYQPVRSSNWLIVSGDGAGNASLVDTGVAVNTAVTTALQFTYDGNGTVKFFIGGVLVGSIKGALPANSMPMALFHGICNTTTNATATGVQTTIGFAYAILNYL